MTDNLTIDLQALYAEFPRKDVTWRPQGNVSNNGTVMALAYIDARDVMDRLDTVCGPHNWQDAYTETPKGRVFCTISINFGNDEWVGKADGAGATEMEGDKGAISDAFKRAAVKWGIGRYLYDLDSPWVPCETYVGKDGKTRFKRFTVDPWLKVRRAPRVFELHHEVLPDHPETRRATVNPDGNSNVMLAGADHFGTREIAETPHDEHGEIPDEHRGSLPMTSDTPQAWKDAIKDELGIKYTMRKFWECYAARLVEKFDSFKPGKRGREWVVQFEQTHSEPIDKMPADLRRLVMDAAAAAVDRKENPDHDPADFRDVGLSERDFAPGPDPMPGEFLRR